MMKIKHPAGLLKQYYISAWTAESNMLRFILIGIWSLLRGVIKNLKKRTASYRNLFKQPHPENVLTGTNRRHMDQIFK